MLRRCPGEVFPCSVAAAVLLVVLASPARSPAQANVAKAASSEPAFVEITDEAGRRVKVPQPVRRIVSVAPSVTETLYALGAQDRLVGVTDYCDYPPRRRRNRRSAEPSTRTWSRWSR